MIATALSDAELLDQARRGEEAAFTELYVRHQAAARRLASAYPRAGDPDDLVNGAFERVLGALRRDAGPTDSFRAYLFVTLRRLAAENVSRSKDDPFEEVPEPVEAEARAPAMDFVDREIVLQAFESIPERSQAVLWHTAIEGRDPKDVAPVLGMSANAAAALAYRAREKLRQAYLQAHLQASPRPGCEPHRSRLGAFVREGLSTRDQTATEQHLDGCESCRGLVAELLDINRVLNSAVVPLFAASAADVAALAGGAAGGAASGAGPLRLAKQGYSKARNNPAGSAVAAAALALTLVAGMISMRGDGEDPPPDTSAGTPDEAVETASPTPDQPVMDEPPDTPPPEEPAPAEPEPEPEPEEAPPEEPAPTSTSAPNEPDETVPEERPPAPPDEPPAEPPTTEPPPTTAPATPEPPVPAGPVVWNAATSTLEITLTNSGDADSDYMLLNVTLFGGAVVGGGPSGCGLAVAVVITAECGVNPIPPKSATVVRLPVTATSPGQRATVSQCTIGLLRLSCGGPILRTTTVGLE